MSEIKTRFTTLVHSLQDLICDELEKCDEKGRFAEDTWERPGGGGGKTRVLSNSNVIEKGGVNTSVVHGQLPESIKAQLNVKHTDFFACGISLVIHPVNPFIPTTHLNFRYFELYDASGQMADCWFGGGVDLTPYYLNANEVIYFHKTLKQACDEIHPAFYPEFKKDCDDYFFIKHRQEMRGVGGIFYDYKRPDRQVGTDSWIKLAQLCGEAFLKAYVPMMQDNKSKAFTESHKQWQELRRGRYVEFNLVQDRGTLFGLKTDGRVESILMSLPAVARWQYNFKPQPGSPEDVLQQHLHPIDWINYHNTLNHEFVLSSEAPSSK